MITQIRDVFPRLNYHWRFYKIGFNLCNHRAHAYIAGALSPCPAVLKEDGESLCKATQG